MPTLSLPLILGSTSPVRAEILRALKLDFTTASPLFDEEAVKDDIAHLAPAEQGLALAKGKAESISANHPDALILACDQICECEGEILSKPGNAERAVLQLQRLRGKTHYQHSAACVYLNGEMVWSFVASATLEMRALSDAEISRYVAMDEPFGSCGSYMLERHGKHIFNQIDGSDDVIKGIPSIEFLSFLYAQGHLVL